MYVVYILAITGTQVNTRRHQMHKKTETGMLKPDEAHALIGKDKISRRGFYNAINRGEVPHRRLGKRILIPRFAFMAWLEGREQGAA
jgi:excisionase family DNA binding protein